MSLLEELIRQLGSVEIDATGLVLEVDGKRIGAESAIKITVAASSVAGKTAHLEPLSVKPAPAESGEAAEAADATAARRSAEPIEDPDEWEWQIAMARAKSRSDELAPVATQKSIASLHDDNHMQRIDQLRRMLEPRPIVLESTPILLTKRKTTQTKRKSAPAKRTSAPAKRKRAPVAKRKRAPRAKLGTPRVALGTAPPVPTDDDVTKRIDIRPLPDRSGIKREPPPLPPPPID